MTYFVANIVLHSIVDGSTAVRSTHLALQKDVSTIDFFSFMMHLSAAMMYRHYMYTIRRLSLTVHCGYFLVKPRYEAMPLIFSKKIR